MRKIIQFLLLSAMMHVFANKLCAQSLPKVLAFGNFTYANPYNTDFKNHYNNGVGFEVGAGIGFKKTIFIGSLGYMNYTGSGNTSNLKVMPVKVGVREYLIGKLFVNGNIGLAIQSSDNISGSSANTFLYEVGAGVKVIKILELGLAYTGWKQANTSSAANSVLFKVGFSIKI